MRVVYRIRVPRSLALTVRFIAVYVEVMTATLKVSARLSTLSHTLPDRRGGVQGLEGGVVV